jgi:hypothetical protein
MVQVAGVDLIDINAEVQRFLESNGSSRLANMRGILSGRRARLCVLRIAHEEHSVTEDRLLHILRFGCNARFVALHRASVNERLQLGSFRGPH